MRGSRKRLWGRWCRWGCRCPIVGLGEGVAAAWVALVAAELQEVEGGGDGGVEESFLDEACGVFAGGGVTDLGADFVEKFCAVGKVGLCAVADEEAAT